MQWRLQERALGLSPCLGNRKYGKRQGGRRRGRRQRSERPARLGRWIGGPALVCSCAVGVRSAATSAVAQGSTPRRRMRAGWTLPLPFARDCATDARRLATDGDGCARGVRGRERLVSVWCAESLLRTSAIRRGLLLRRCGPATAAANMLVGGPA